jgi:excinuclease ABC subunit A
MHFLADLYVPCDICHGKRYNRETLDIRYRGRNIHEVLEMTTAQAAEFFSAVPAIARKLQTLIDVGLGYVRLGQSATTLSGGEAQRVKLSLELSKRDTGRTLYILDEPTTGLHFHDIRLLLNVLHRLRDAGNTVVVIEHNIDVVKTADWVIDMGPEGGEGGGRIVAEGTPEQIAASPKSFTGKYLKQALAPARRVA